jgi:release factor glutamine methyltransferase
MTVIRDALEAAARALEGAGIAGAKAEARALAAFVTGLTPAQIFSRDDTELSDADAARFDAVIRRRITGEPAAYIIGLREFWSLPFKVTPATLIPRPDTESVIELVMQLFADRARPQRILDIGTGSGCLVLALLDIYADACGIGTDISASALSVASENAKALGLSDRATMIEGAWSAQQAGPFDLIVSNPPYIPSPDIATLEPTVRAFEPLSALDGGADGLDAYRNVLAEVSDILSNAGWVVLEVGIHQADPVTEIARNLGLVEGPRQCDIAGIDRALSFHKKSVGILGGSG